MRPLHRNNGFAAIVVRWRILASSCLPPSFGLGSVRVLSPTKREPIVLTRSSRVALTTFITFFFSALLPSVQARVSVLCRIKALNIHSVRFLGNNARHSYCVPHGFAAISVSAELCCNCPEFHEDKRPHMAIVSREAYCSTCNLALHGFSSYVTSSVIRIL